MLETLYTCFGIFDQHNTYLTNQDNFLDTVFPFLGFSIIGLAILFVVLYYIVLNRLSSSFNSIGSWAIFLVCNALVAGGVALYESATNTQAETGDAFVLTLGVLNALYATLLYVLFSVGGRYGSKYAKGTPF